MRDISIGTGRLPSAARAAFLAATFFAAVLPLSTPAQVVLTASASTEAYVRIASKGYAIEVPDCKHAVKHITTVPDADLGKDVFVFTLHRDLDDDRCEASDRQRVEIKTWDQSPLNMVAIHGETHTYRWKFKLDAGFKPSNSFTHIHQIKAQGGSDADDPLFTFTPRLTDSEKLQILHFASSGSEKTVAEANLALFKGHWVEAEERITYGDKGSLALTLRKVKDGTTLLAWSDADLDMWRTGAKVMRPKYGLYRSLGDKSRLRDESVRFADFCLAEGATLCTGNETVVLPKNPGRTRRSPWNGTLDLVAPDGRAWSGRLPPRGWVLLSTPGRP